MHTNSSKKRLHIKVKASVVSVVGDIAEASETNKSSHI
jgi:hypothetical protein